MIPTASTMAFGDVTSQSMVVTSESMIVTTQSMVAPSTSMIVTRQSMVANERVDGRGERIDGRDTRSEVLGDLFGCSDERIQDAEAPLGPTDESVDRTNAVPSAAGAALASRVPSEAPVAQVDRAAAF
jgi:hypothetical protein